MGSIFSVCRRKKSSHSARVKTPVVVPMARTQLAPDGAGRAADNPPRPRLQQAEHITRREGVAAAAAVHKRHRIRRRT